MITIYKVHEINQTRFYKVPKELIENPTYNKSLNSDAKLLYAMLLDRMELSRKNNWVNENDEIYLLYTRENLAEDLGVCRNTIIKACKLLNQMELIKEVKQGLGKPNIIYIGKTIEEKQKKVIPPKQADAISSTETKAIPQVEETDPRYVEYHVCSFVDFLQYESAKRRYTQEHIDWLKSLPYKEYLLTPHWGMLKNLILGRDGRTCKMCKKSHVEVHVHHLTYENRGREDINDLACLCSECHSKIHGK